jgi:hypothetical protein
MPRLNHTVRAFLTLLALLALLLGYYWVHKPFDLPLLVTAGGAVYDVLIVLLIGAVGGGLGRRILHRANLAPLANAERVALEGVVGLGALSVALLLLGLVGLFRLPVMLALLVGVLAFTARDTWRWAGELRETLRKALAVRSGAKLLALLLIGLAALRAFAPPYAWDALAYHLVGPRRYLASGQITASADNFFLGLSQSVEMLYSLGMALTNGDTVTGGLHLWFGGLAFLAVGGLLRRFTDEATAWLGVLLLLSAYSLWLLLAWPYVDMAVLACGALLLSALTAWRESGRTTWLIIGGGLIGLGVGVKYTAGAMLPAALVYVATVLLTEQDRRAALRKGVIAGLALGLTALIVFLPWALKGMALYGNPLYPFVFGGLEWDAGRTAQFNSGGLGLRGETAWQLAVLPVAATLFGLERQGAFAFDAGPWLLSLPLLLVLGFSALPARARALGWDCARLGLPYWLIWLVLSTFTSVGTQTRLMMMAVPVAAVAGALAVYSLRFWPRKPFDVGFILRAALVLTLGLTAVDALRETLGGGSANVFAGLTSRAAYIEERTGAHYPALARLAELPEGARVRLMWEPRAYYCPPQVFCEGDVMLDHWTTPMRRLNDPAQIFADWRARGVTHVLVHDLGLEFELGEGASPVQSAQIVQFAPALAAAMVPLWTDGVAYTLYGWR